MHSTGYVRTDVMHSLILWHDIALNSPFTDTEFRLGSGNSKLVQCTPSRDTASCS